MSYRCLIYQCIINDNRRTLLQCLLLCRRPIALQHIALDLLVTFPCDHATCQPPRGRSVRRKEGAGRQRGRQSRTSRLGGTHWEPIRKEEMKNGPMGGKKMGNGPMRSRYSQEYTKKNPWKAHIILLYYSPDKSAYRTLPA